MKRDRVRGLNPAINSWRIGQQQLRRDPGNERTYSLFHDQTPQLHKSAISAALFAIYLGKCGSIT